MRSSSTLFLSLLILPLLSACAVEAPTTEQESVTGSMLGNSKANLMLAASACEGACTNYMNKCLTLVPGATQQIFKDGLVSCVQECNTWAASKIECLLNAPSCTAMTNECEL